VKAGQRTIIHELLGSGLPDAEKDDHILSQQAQVLVAAGSVTTTTFLKSVIYFILTDAEVLRRLKTELKSAIPDPSEIPPLHKLERLPYLSAVIKEGGRMVPGQFARMVRIAPEEDLRCGQWTIPRGTSVGMSTWIQHNEHTLFPEPEKFRPERWLTPRDGGNAVLERYLVPFGKGTRNCLGINLAMAEMYLTLALLFRRFEFELFETDRTDVELAHEWATPHSRKYSKGVRVLVRSEC
jgi:cytochrome P450